VPEHLAPSAEAVAAGAPGHAPRPLDVPRRRKQRLPAPEPLAPSSSPRAAAAGSKRGGVGSARGGPARRWWARCRRRWRIYGVQLLLLARMSFPGPSSLRSGGLHPQVRPPRSGLLPSVRFSSHLLSLFLYRWRRWTWWLRRRVVAAVLVSAVMGGGGSGRRWMW
jgi:hypothetical protein